MEKRKGVGVVIGRFQVADLHEGHQSVIAEANKHHKLCIFIGVEPSRLGVRSDPLDYATREQMVKLSFPKAQVFELTDQYTDEHWTNLLDHRLHTLYPRDSITMYCGRDSFKKHYGGKHEVREIDSVQHLSGTDLRDIDGSTVENHASFRRGVIYAAYNRWDPIYPCVDIACTRIEHNQIKVLVGQRRNEGGLYRLPGGHVDPTDETDELAAKRELYEETGVECSDMEFVWSGRIKARGDRPGAGTKRTIFFHTHYLHGPAKGADDLDSVGWVPVNRLKGLKWVDDHARLAQFLQDYVEKRGAHAWDSAMAGASAR